MTQLSILIVEDNQTNLLLMARLVERVEGCTAIAMSDPGAVLAELDTLDFQLAIVDFQMPGLDGVSLVRAIRAHPRHRETPTVMVTADDDPETRLAALDAGAVEFLHKPIDPIEFMTRIRNLARLCEAQRVLADRAEWLRREVDAATAALRRREEEIVHRLALAASYKDDETGAHMVRMAAMCGRIARALCLDEETAALIERAAPMHDIGKVGIRDDVLQKQGLLTPEERTHMQRHAGIGGAILSGSQCDLLRLAAEIAETHHERWDGSGYPAGLAGEAIPLSGRIAAVADVFDALISARSYKRAWPVAEAIAFVRDQSGRHFDPACVDAFLRIIEADQPASEATGVHETADTFDRRRRAVA